MRLQAAGIVAYPSVGAATSLRNSPAALLPSSSSGAAAQANVGRAAAVERLRFCLDGQPLGLAPAGECGADATAVVQRDLLRCALAVIVLLSYTPSEDHVLLSSSQQDACQAATLPADIALAIVHFCSGCPPTMMRTLLLRRKKYQRCMSCCRQDEALPAEGYTLREACQLARSSLPAQRAAACRLLASVLAAAQPRADGSSCPRPVELPKLGQVCLP